MTRSLPAFAAAALVALTGAAGFVLLAGGTTFSVGMARVPLVYVLTPLVALALFQLVFGLTTRRWRGSRFWMVALPLSALLWGGGLYLVLEAWLTPRTVLWAEAAVHLVAGLLALRLTEGT
nr:hypothetical protein [Paracoccus saliphilus]